MRLLISMAVLTLSAVSFQTQAQVADARVRNLESAIERNPSLIRHDLARCLENWRFYPERRAKYDELIGDADFAKAPMIALQVGNSGFGRYDFIVVNEEKIESSFTKKLFPSSGKLNELDKILRKIEGTDLVEASSPSQEDGDCYFLDSNRGGKIRHIKFYGTPGSTKAGLLIRKMLELVR